MVLENKKNIEKIQNKYVNLVCVSYTYVQDFIYAKDFILNGDLIKLLWWIKNF